MYTNRRRSTDEKEDVTVDAVVEVPETRSLRVYRIRRLQMKIQRVETKVNAHVNMPKLLKINKSKIQHVKRLKR